jgi:ABC-2 type transport system permease protein
VSALAAIFTAQARQLGHSVASVQRESTLKVAVVSFGMVFLWLVLFGIAWAMFRLVDHFGVEMLGDAAIAISEVLMPRMLAIAALVLQAMLVLSCGLLAFQSFFRSTEMRLLLGTPAPLRAIAAAKLSEVAFFGAWSAAYLGSPVLLAYGLVRHAPWTLYPLALLAFIPFVVIPAALGCMLALVAARLLPRLPRAGLLVALALVAVVAVLALRPRLAEARFRDSMDLAGLVQITGRAHSPYLPSTWFAEAVVAAGRRDTHEVGFHLTMLAANAVFAAWLLGGVAQATLLGAWSALASTVPVRRSARRGTWLPRLLAPLPAPWRWLTIKDALQFARDPAQWSQAAVFFGVLALYVANMRTEPRAFSAIMWQGWITLLNTLASLLVAATLTTRFIFPLISLEGRRFWILGLAPVRRRTIIWQKLTLSTVVTAVVTGGLALLSGLRLHLPPLSLAVALLTVLAASLALSALAVGLGALYPNFREENPGRIVSGLGGTLCFILSMLYVAMAATAQTFALRWAEVARHWGVGWSSTRGVLACLAALVVLTALTTWLPLRAGIRHLDRVEL